MESNPFFSEQSKALNSQRPVKFNMKINSKFLKNPYNNSKSDATSTKQFVGPLLPNGATKSSGYSSKHDSCRENGREHPNSENGPDCENSSAAKSETSVAESKAESAQENTEVKQETTPSPVVKCTECLSSLDILKSTYKDDSDDKEPTLPYNPNALPVLVVKKKKGSSENSGKLNNGAEQKLSAGNVFERLGAKSAVKSWTGEASSNFKNDNETWKSIENPNKRVRDEYDEELDQGKVKKVKHQKDKQNGREKHDFQKAHEYNKNQKRWEERSSWGNRQNGKHPKYFWKSKKQTS